MPETKKMITKTLQVPKSYQSASPSVNSHYNESSGLIVLEGPRGPMLARYHGKAFPDPRRFKFETTFARDYSVFEGAKIPTDAPADASAIARPVEANSDPRMGVVSGSNGDPVKGGGAEKPRRMITAESGYDASALNLSGIEIKPASLHMHAGGGGMSLDGDGVRVEGGMKQPATQKKGLTMESPLFGLIPKTAITFFASDYLPNIKLLLRMKRYVDIIRSMPTLYQSLRRIVGELGGDLPGQPRRNYSPREAGREMADYVS